MSYNESDWDEVKIEVEPAGKAPRKYGDDAYRFPAPLTMSVIMPKRGWELVKETKNYVYLKPPVDAGKPPFEISIKIPNRTQALEIANLCFNKAESWMGQLGEWPAWYLHERPQETYELLASEDGFVKKLAFIDHPKSSLNIGQYGIWSVVLCKTIGEFSFQEYGVVKWIGDNSSVHPLLEGRELSVELSKYERNPIAREKCIQHFGSICQICLVDLGKVYGPVGEGCIHVHHITPISEMGGEYEIDPIADLIPLCPNCHAIIHRKNPPYTVAELKIFQNSKVSGSD